MRLVARGVGVIRGRSILDHPSIHAVRGSPPLALRSDGLPVLPLPGPPASGAEWAVRRLALLGVVPALAPALRAVPAGWIGVLEIAAHALDGQGLARGLRFARLGARGGALTLWPEADDTDPIPRAAAVQAICEWAEARSGDTCMAHGTPGAASVVVGDRRLALGPRARDLPAAELRRLLWPDGGRDRPDTAGPSDP